MLTEQRNPRTVQIDTLPTLDMLRVIHEEDATVMDAVRQALPAIAQAVDAVTDCFRRGGRLIYVGAGTSGRLGMLDAVECMPTFSAPPDMVQAIMAGGPSALVRSVEGAEDDQDAGRDRLLALKPTTDDAVVGIAASGRTPFVLSAIDTATEVDALTIGVACNVPSPLLDRVDIPVGVPVGPEVITGSTRLKAGTATKLVLNMLSTASMVKLGKVYGNLMVDVVPTNEKLVQRARRIVTEVAGVEQEQAARLLTQADQEVKTAIVMARRGVTPDAARALLAQADGRLRDVID
jgi:N-acetylmuramic acid 6-phosphate etherase